MENELSELIQGFVDESHEAFESIENDLLSIESNPDDLSIVNGVFRVLHTIKGTAGFMGLDEIQHLSHSLESIFDKIRKGEIKITSDLLDNILPAIDLLKLMVFELIETEKSNYDLENTFLLLDQINKGEAISSQKQAPQVQEEAVSQDLADQTEDQEFSKQEPENKEKEEEQQNASKELRKEFVLEADEHLEIIEQSLLKLEKDPRDQESINEVFRGIHSIKGTASYVNLKKIIGLTHVIETLFDKIRQGDKKYNDEMADVVLKSMDILRTLVFMVKMDEDMGMIETEEIIIQLRVFLEQSDKASPAEQEKVEEDSSTEQVRLDEKTRLAAFQNVSSQQLETIRSLGSQLAEKELGIEEMNILHRSLNTLMKSANKIANEEIAGIANSLDELILAVLAEEKQHEEIKIEFINSLSRLLSAVNNLDQEPGQSQKPENATEPPPVPEIKNISPKDPSKTPNKAVSADKGQKSNESEIKTMRIESHRLDTFMNLIGELIIARNSFNHILGEMVGIKQLQSIAPELRGVENAFNRISEDLQTTLMEMRLIPVKAVFQKIPRIVRDISRKTNKKIQLQMIGENTQIDKSIIEVIGDPLVHIIRNSCDHGIESVDDRVKANKPETGNIILKASHLGSVIAIDIIDDGAGINTEKVLKKAVELGLVKEDQIEKLDKKTINNFIFHPGFSTAKEVSDISGRGVGMDVVITNINKIHGTVDVDSEQGSGTQIRLLLPLTLAIVDALLVVDNNQKYAIPLEAVKESIEVRESELQLLNQKEAINLRGNIIGVSRMASLLGLPEKEPDPDRVVSIVFIQVGARVMGLVVDDLSNQQEIVVKPLQQYLSKIPGIGGSTILGSGDIILILEPTELVDLAVQ